MTMCGSCVIFFCCVLLTILGVKGVMYMYFLFLSHVHSSPHFTNDSSASLPLQPQFVSFQTLYFHDNVFFLLMTPHLSLHIPVQPQRVSIQHCAYQCAHACACTCACTCTCMYFIIPGHRPFPEGLGPRLVLYIRVSSLH